jgi:dTDP-4-dehydrorhamnose reductase
VDVLNGSGSFDVVALTHEAADCTDASAVRAVLLATQPQIVINSAAYVRVDDCEDHPDEAFRTNAVGAFNIARACAKCKSLCVYISTDYVFDGNKGAPYTESDVPSPVNVYGASKLAGEQLVRLTAPRWLIVRTASLFGKTGARAKGGNFVDTVIGKAKGGDPLRIVNDMRMSPTYTRDAAAMILRVIEAGADGIVHLVNGGECSWYEFARKALEFCGVRADLTPVSSSEYKTKARRPKNAALASENIHGILGTPPRSWEQALEAYLVEKRHVAA